MKAAKTFTIHRHPDPALKGWTYTHLPTGLWSTSYKTKRDVVALTKELEAAADWTFTDIHSEAAKDTLRAVQEVLKRYEEKQVYSW